jgi:hypothetical protein
MVGILPASVGFWFLAMERPMLNLDSRDSLSADPVMHWTCPACASEVTTRLDEFDSAQCDLCLRDLTPEERMRLRQGMTRVA